MERTAMPGIKALLQRKLLLLGLIIILAFVIMAVFAPWLAPYPPEDSPDQSGIPLAPSGQFWFGTDTHGRDLLSRLIFGARATLIVAIFANTIAVAIGVLICVSAGYTRGWIGN